MIELRDVGFSVSGDDATVLATSTSPSTRASWSWSPGRTGVGKSTLLGVLNGLVPRFTGGRLAGDVLLDGVSIVRRPPRERAHVVGYVGQDPLAGFVTDTVEEELAYGMEQLGLPPADDAHAGSRRRSTCSASPSCAAATCAPCPAGSSSGSRSARC